MAQTKASQYLKALDSQIDLLQFYDTPTGRAFLRGEYDKLVGKKGQRQVPFSRDADGTMTERLTRGLLHEATPVYVAPWITSMLREALPTLPDSIPLHRDDIPFDLGFAYLDGPPWDLSPTSAGFINRITAFAWIAVESAVHIVVFGTVHSQQFSTEADNLNQYLFEIAWRFGKPIDDSEGFDIQLAKFGDDMDVQINFIDEHIQIGKKEVKAGELFTTEYVRQMDARRLIYSIWHFMQQRIVSIADGGLDRARRRSLPPNYESSIVKVIELRARESTRRPDYDEETREYNVRWIVRGHWRSQWYPSLNRHKPVWVHAYVKGPEDKPLKAEATKLFAVVR